MTDDSAMAVSAFRRQFLYGTFEAVKDVPLAIDLNTETLVVFVSANFTFCHRTFLLFHFYGLFV